MASVRYPVILVSLFLAACGDTGGDNEAPGDAGGGDAGGDVAEQCTYPTHNDTLYVDEVIPPLYWDDARDDQGRIFPFSLEDFHCDEAYAEYDSLAIVVSAEWCPNCPDYMRRIDGLEAELEAAGMLILYVEAETSDYTAPTSAQANAHINRTLNFAGGGIRVGDADTRPGNRFFYYAPAVDGFPSGFVVRKRDMRVIAAQNVDPYILDWRAIADDLDANWGDPPPANCDASDEEDSEGPNNNPATAPTLVPGVPVSGGVCDFNGDFYNVEVAGDWRVDLTFTHGSDADLDVVVWDTDAGQYLTDSDGNAIGSYSETDNESFTYSGPAQILILGYDNSTAPYVLTLTEL